MLHHNPDNLYNSGGGVHLLINLYMISILYNWWFMCALFFGKVSARICLLFFRGRILLIVALLSVLLPATLNSIHVMVPNYFYLMNGFVALFFVLIGVFCKGRMVTRKQGLIAGGFYLLCACIAALFGIQPSYALDIKFNLASLPIFLILSLSGTIALVSMARFISRMRLGSIFKLLGQNSLLIYFFHFTVIILMRRLITDISDVTPAWAWYFVFSFVALVVSCSASILIMRTKLKVLIGKW